MEKYQDVIGTLGYVTAEDPTNTDEHYLAEGSRDVLIDQQRKVKSRAGYELLGAVNTAMTPVRQAMTWNNSKGGELPTRVYDDELEVYLGTVDGTDIDAWTRVASGLSTTATPRFAVWWDATEVLDLLLFVQGDDNVYEWNGAVAVVSSVGAGTVTKTGTATFAENRFYTTRNKTVVCVRTGTEYTYTGGEGTTTLTGIADTTGLQAGDILIQKIVTRTDEPASGRNNDTIFVFQNHVVLGSADDSQVYLSKNTSITDYSFSSPRVPGEGVLLTFDNPAQAFAALGETLTIFSGPDSAFGVSFKQIEVGSSLAEVYDIEKLLTGYRQSARSQELVIPMGDAIAYVSFEPALRIIENPKTIDGTDPKTFSNPIKPDFDAADWTGATGIWHKNAIHLALRADSRMLILEFVQDADGKVRRFWQPPQFLPVGSLSIVENALIGHSNAVAESYALFSGLSDRVYEGMDTADKLPIRAVAAFAYRTFGSRSPLKTFDEYHAEGQITDNTDVTLTLNYDFGGATQIVQKVIEGSDPDITFEDQSLIGLGQKSLGTQPMGGSAVEPSSTLNFEVVFEIPKEDFHMIQEVYEMDQTDGYFSILSRGMNARLSPRRDTVIRK